MQVKTEPIHFPSAAAKQMGLSVPDLVAIIRRCQYPFTEVKPGGKPGDRGRNRWGLTDSQMATILRGQERAFRPPQENGPETPRRSAASPDGKSRIRYGPVRPAKR